MRKIKTNLVKFYQLIAKFAKESIYEHDNFKFYTKQQEKSKLSFLSIWPIVTYLPVLHFTK